MGTLHQATMGFSTGLLLVTAITALPFEGEKLWRDDGRCGVDFTVTLNDGRTIPGQCDPHAEATERGPCCSTEGWCWTNCTCDGCVDYSLLVHTGQIDDDTLDRSTCEPLEYSGYHTMNKYPGPSDDCLKKTKDSGISESIAGVIDEDSKNTIVRVHNELRNKVAMGEETSGPQPSAANMRKIAWDDELATIAQRWADQCKYGHDHHRNGCDNKYVGQNAYESDSSEKMEPYSSVSTVEAAVRAWYEEVKQPGFKPTNTANLKSEIQPFAETKVPESFQYGTGHYTQVVWAETTMVGCGMRYYAEGGWYTSLVFCNYAIGGNFIGENTYELGPPCSNCPDGTSCDSEFPGLCA